MPVASPTEFEQPWQVWKTYLASGRSDQRSRDSLWKHNDGLAQTYAERWSRQCEIEYDDLLQLARIGLLKAIKRYDPATGNRFSSLAAPWIKGEILHFLRDYGRLYKIPRDVRESAAQVRRLREKLLAKGRDVSLERCAEHFCIDEQTWQWIEEATERRPMVEIGGQEDLQLTDEPVDADDELYTAVRQALAQLPPREQSFVVEYAISGVKAQTIAQREGLSEPQVRASIHNSLEQIKASLRYDDDDNA